MKIPFMKAQGAGNDFIIVDKNVDFIRKSKKVIKRLCDRRFGVGCDQLILLKKISSYYQVTFYNSDGSLGKNCGNGLRCAYKFLVEVKKVKKYRDKLPLFFKENIEKKLFEIFKTEVKLSSGGYLVINPTEALVSIDINSGSSIKGKNVESTALDTNIEAAEEIARQIKIRDLSGLIIIDFIDMMNFGNRRLLNGD